MPSVPSDLKARGVGGGLGALLAAPALFGRAARAQDAEWRLGAPFLLTGNLSVLGPEALTGAAVDVGMANERGAVLGRRASLVKADAPNAANATNGARRLVTREGLRFLLGTYNRLREVNAGCTTILLVVQDLKMALKVAHRASVLGGGRVVLSGPSADLAENPRLLAAYLGR